MTEFWESAFKSNERMWGERPVANALKVLELLKEHRINNVLIPGFGYGRNAKVFHDAGLEVTGIEISATAIERARRKFGKDVRIHHGSVTDMPYDTARYQSIYCYSLIHLLKKSDRKKFIADCYSQLLPGGIMVFVALSINDRRFGEGEEVEKKTFHSPNGLDLYFYDAASVMEEFGDYNLKEAKEINEPITDPTEKHWMIVCQKPAAEP